MCHFDGKIPLSDSVVPDDEPVIGYKRLRFSINWNTTGTKGKSEFRSPIMDSSWRGRRLSIRNPKLLDGEVFPEYSSRKRDYRSWNEGIYTYSSLRTAQGGSSWRRLCIARVALTGRVLKFRGGFLAQRARIEAVYFLPNAEFLADECARRYRDLPVYLGKRPWNDAARAEMERMAAGA